MKYNSIIELIGNTPLVKLNKIESPNNRFVFSVQDNDGCNLDFYEDKIVYRDGFSVEAMPYSDFSFFQRQAYNVLFYNKRTNSHLRFFINCVNSKEDNEYDFAKADIPLVQYLIKNKEF